MWFLLFLLIAGGTFVGWRELGTARSSAPAVEVGRVLRVGGADNQSGVSANGYIVARRRAALSTDIQGRLVEVPVEEGSRVEAGALIARIDTRQVEASRARAAADLEQARANAELARLESERQEKLFADGHSSASERDAAAAERLRTEALLESNVANLQEIDVIIEKSSVFAPFSGVIVEKNAEVGEVVSSIGSSGPNARGAVATLVDFDSLEVQVELPQTALQAAADDAPTLIYLDAYPEDGFRGRVRQIWPTANRQKATVEVRIRFEQKDDRVLPEMGCRVVFVPNEGAEAKPTEVLLPPRALLTGSENVVFLYRRGVAERRVVEIDPVEKNGYLAVTSGLTGGELVILDPPESLTDGSEVTREEPKP